MKKVFTVLLSLICIFNFFGCGSHEQSLRRVDVVEPIKSADETDPLKIIINAISSGDLEQVKLSIENGVDINSYDNEGLRLIMHAIRAEQFAVMDYLILQGADLLLTTQSDRFQPEVSAFEYLDFLMPSDDVNTDMEIKGILLGILNQETFSLNRLSVFVFVGINRKDPYLVDWVLQKGVDPNVVVEDDISKHSPLIHIFTLNGVEDVIIEGKEIPHFQNLERIFYLLVNHPDIDVNLKVGRYTPLKRAKRRLRQDPRYQGMVDHLISMGAQE